MPLFATISQGCAYGAGVLTLLELDPAPAAGDGFNYGWAVVDTNGNDYGGSFDGGQLPLETPPLPDDTYQVQVRAIDPVSGAQLFSSPASFTITCAGGGGGGGGGLVLVQQQLTQPTLTTPTGSVILGVLGTGPSGGGVVEPLTVDVPGLTNGPVTIQYVAGSNAYQYAASGIVPGYYTASFADADSPPHTLDVPFTIDDAPEAVTGCQDEYATDYNPAATAAAACAYAVNWVSAWGLAAVRVPALSGQTEAYTTALLRTGFRPGHPNAADRPLGPAIVLRATVGPDGYATFRLGPELRAALGAADGAGGYRLDLNSPTAAGLDLYTGFELRRLGGELLAHGYAVNAAVPDAELVGQLSPFAGRLPVWPGFDDYLVPYLSASTQDRFGIIENDHAYQFTTVAMPCPANPLPVAWLAPGGGFGYWVFAGRPQLGDEVGEGSTFQEASTGERRFSSRGEARRTVSASTGPFKGLDLLEGLRTLVASPQVWYQPKLGGPWVPVTLESGSFPAGRLGVNRQQFSISFTEASARYAQGQ